VESKEDILQSLKTFAGMLRITGQISGPRDAHFYRGGLLFYNEAYSRAEAEYRVALSNLSTNETSSKSDLNLIQELCFNLSLC
jgi:hypothetical protein